MARHRHAVTIKIYYWSDQTSQEDIMDEIESWPDIEEVQNLGVVQADKEVVGTWPEDEPEKEEEEEDDEEWEEL